MVSAQLLKQLSKRRADIPRSLFKLLNLGMCAARPGTMHGLGNPNCFVAARTRRAVAFQRKHNFACELHKITTGIF